MTTLAAWILLLVAGFGFAATGITGNRRAAGIAYTALFAAVGCLLIGEFV